MGKALFKSYESIQAAFAALTAKAQETLAGIRVVKAHVEEEGEQRVFRALHDDYTEKNRGMIRIMSAMWPALTLLGGIASAIVLWVGGTAVGPRPDHSGRPGGVPDLPRDAAVADDRVRLGHQSVPARIGVDEPDP